MRHVPSPPARGAWIETLIVVLFLCIAEGRPPRGGRGLKQHI